MDLFSGKKPTNPGEKDQPPATDLLTSAKGAALAAQSTVVGAAGNLVEATSKGVTQCVEKVQTYVNPTPTGDEGKAPPPSTEAKGDEKPGILKTAQGLFSK